MKCFTYHFDATLKNLEQVASVLWVAGQISESKQHEKGRNDYDANFAPSLEIL